MNRAIIPNFILVAMKARAGLMVNRFSIFLTNSKKIIDIGSGTCLIAFHLQREGRKVTPVDIQNNSIYPEIKVIVYDGLKLPFKGKSFDTALLITVLHHTPSPEIVLKEAIRVSDKIIVVETTYENWLGKIFIVFVDTLANLTISVHWNSYKTNSEWQELFRKFNLTIKSNKRYLTKQWGASYIHRVYFLENS